jgi:orotate phosphoribosyltransferase
MDAALRRDLEKELLTYALKFGEFTLTSGRKSDYYIDSRLITLRPRGAFLVARLLLDEVKSAPVDAIGGPTIAADPVIGALMALASLESIPVVGFLVRKEAKGHGMRRVVEGPIEPGMRVAVFDDVATTGGSIKEAIDQVEASHCTVVNTYVIVDRQEGAQANFAQWGYPFHAFFTIAELKAARHA